MSERQMTCANSFCAPNAPLSVFSPLNLTSNSQTVFGISNKINSYLLSADREAFEIPSEKLWPSVFLALAYSMIVLG